MKDLLTPIPSPAHIDKDPEGFWYLATPYSKYPHGTWFAFIHAARVGAWLLCHDVRHYRPIVASHPVAVHGDIDPLDHGIWMEDNAPFMEAACGIIVANMDGWERSHGISLEVEHFRAAGKPMYLLDVSEVLS